VLEDQPAVIYLVRTEISLLVSEGQAVVPGYLTNRPLPFLSASVEVDQHDERPRQSSHTNGSSSSLVNGDGEVLLLFLISLLISSDLMA
jgi:hypothetical protein